MEDTMTTQGYQRGSGLIRHRSRIEMDDRPGVVHNVVERIREAIHEIRDEFRYDDRDLRIVLDVYVTEHPDPLANDDHEPIGLED